MKRGFEKVSLPGLTAFVLLSAGGVAVLAMLWKFGIEEWLDPWLPGIHATDSEAERWEFVVMASLFSALALVVPAFVVARLFADRLAADRLASAVFDSAPQPMVVTDARRCIIAVNPAFEALTGHAAASIIGQPVGCLKSDQQDPAFYRELGRALDSSGSWAGELHNQRPDGSPYVIWLSITATRDAAGRVGEYIGVMTDITWRKQREEQALHLAMHDPLTGLANRRLFLERLQQVMASARVSGEVVALLFIDLDGFKQVNDSHGHAAGDEVLKVASQRLNACARAADMVARLAGDEFVILLREVESAEAAGVVARRCVDSLAEPITLAAVEARIGASIGIALSSHRVTSAEALMRLADGAMYEVKRRGRGAFLLNPESQA